MSFSHPAAHEGAFSSQPVTPAVVKILVVDDLEMNRALVSLLLNRFACSLTHADNGSEAVSWWEAGGFDVILMDIQMSVMDGIEAATVIRRRERETGSYTPIIACSADYWKHCAEEYLSLGFDGYLRKPLVGETLVQEILNCLPKKRLAYPITA